MDSYKISKVNKIKEMNTHRTCFNPWDKDKKINTVILIRKHE